MIFNFVLPIYLIGSMAFFWPGMMAYKPQEMFFQYFALLFFVISLIEPPKREVSNKFIGFFLLYALIHTLLISFENVSRIQLLNLFLGAITLKVIAERVDLNTRRIGLILLFFCLFNLGLMYLQSINQDPIFASLNFDKKPEVDLVGFMGSRYAVGALGALSMPFIYLLSPFLCVVPLALVLVGKSSTLALSLGLGFLFLLWFDNRRIFWTLFFLSVSLFVAYVAFDYETGQFHLRLNTWREGLNYLAGTNPWFGQGLGGWSEVNFFHVQDNGSPKIWRWAHNELLQVFFELGIFALFFIYYFIKDKVSYLSLVTIEDRVIFTSFLILMIFAFFHFPFHVGRFAGISVFIFALGEANANKT